MRIAIIGSGAMGASFGGLLATGGHTVLLLDAWADHVAAINREGLRLTGVSGEHAIRLPAVTALPDRFGADVAMVWTDSNNTRTAAAAADQSLAPDGFAITLQNGIGNVETLVEVLGPTRVAAGSSMCSAAVHGPGQVALTHMGKTSVGEIDGQISPRIEGLAGALSTVGFDMQVSKDIMALIWTKFTLNCAINAICATTGLRLGELARLPATDRFQDLILDEILAVTKAKGITLTDPDLRATVKKHCWSKFSRPSMLQHVDAGKPTEIDALNGRLVEEGRKLGVPTPYNEALALLLKGVEHKAGPARGRSEDDYKRLEAAVEPRPAAR
jgi:2-dehydropantoate 2-reductase